MARAIDPTKQDANNEALYRAVLAGSAARVRKYLAAGADPNVETYFGTPIEAAAGRGFAEIVRLLAKAGADVNDGDNGPLLEAIEKNDTMTALELLRWGATPTSTLRGWNLLIRAAHLRNGKILKALLRAGADPNVRGKIEVFDIEKHQLNNLYGDTTPLVIAARNGEASMVRYLLKAGADPNQIDSNGFTALRWAQQQGHKSVVKLINSPPQSMNNAQRAGSLRGRKTFKPTKNLPAAIQRLEILCGSAAYPTAQIAGAFDLHITATTGFNLDNAHEEWLREGWYLFSTSGIKLSSIIAMPTTDCYEVLRAVGTDAGNYELDTEAIVAWLRKLQREQPFIITGAGHDFLSGTFTTKIKNPAQLARKMYKFCPDIVTQGHETVAALARHLAKTRQLYFWWD